MLNLEGESSKDQEREADHQFWIKTDQILNERNIEVQKRLLLKSVEHLPHVDPAQVEEAMAFAEAEHAGQIRGFTGEPYIIHPLQVTRIGLLLIDRRLIATADVNDLLLHDTVEDCGVDPDELVKKFNATGVRGLSHTVNGGEMLEIPDYFDQIFALNEQDPRLLLPTKKTADLIANGNDPTKKSLLRDPVKNYKKWLKTSDGKVEQMDLFINRLNYQEKDLRRILAQAKVYTKKSKDPDFSVHGFKSTIATMKN